MKDYEELLEHCQTEILRYKSAKKITNVVVKNHLENLRSILEYIAVEINSKLSQPSDKPYFPYASSFTKFSESINRNLKNLKVEKPDIYNLIESIQSYKLNDNWLTDLCNLTNEAKHKNLLRTKKEELKGINIPGLFHSVNSEIIINTLNIGGELFNKFHIKNDTISYENNDGFKLNFEIINEEVIKFEGNEYGVIAFLAKCTENITDFVIRYNKV